MRLNKVLLKKVTKNPSILLMLGYAAGQGSYFVLLLALRASVDADSVGVAVLYFSIFSLCFQFSDLGNSPFGVRCIASGQAERFNNFRIGRALLGMPFVALLAYLSLKDAVPNSAIVFTAIVSIAVLLFGLSNPLKHEIKGDYGRLVFMQALPWAATSFYLWMVSAKKMQAEEWIIALWLFVPVTYYSFMNGERLSFRKIFTVGNIREIFTPLAFLVPHLAGQAWGRWMLVVVTEIFSVASLGPLGLLRNIHTAICLGFGFLFRPRIRRLVLEPSVRGDSSAWLHVAKHMIALSALPLIAVSGLMFLVQKYHFGFADDIIEWIPVLYGVPFWVVGMIVTSANQVVLQPRTFSIIETFSMLAHAATFLVVVHLSGPWAFALADGARCLVLVVTSASLLFFSRLRNSDASR